MQPMKPYITTLFLLIGMTLNVQGQSFRTATTNLTASQQGALALGDLDLDGRLDVIASGFDIDQKASFHLYRNEGETGSAWSFTQVDNSLPSLVASSLDLADFDNDGDLDLLVTSLSVSDVFRNDGGFQFTRLNLGMSPITQVGGVQELVNTPSAAWGDFDSDGDFDVLLTGTELGTSLVYQNMGGGSFIPKNLDIGDLRGGSVEWGDYDNDGDLDILATHQPGPVGSVGFTRIFRNDSGAFVDISANLPGTNGAAFETGSASWGDVDNDNDLDVLFMADRLEGGTSTPVGVFRNDGDNVFTDSNDLLPAAYFGDFSDFDADGRLDVLLNRFDTSGSQSTSTSTFVQFYKNTGNGFAQSQAALPGIWFGAIAIGDLSGDGFPDVLVSGAREENFRVTRDPFIDFYVNEGTDALFNQRPEPPTNLRSFRNGSDLVLEWDAASDPESPSASLTYNVRVGTSPSGNEIVSAMALEDGTRLVARAGNAGHGHRMVIRNLDPNTDYFWAVQAIDAGSVGSAFATEAVATDVAQGNEIPDTFALVGNYPNPFNPGTTIQYSLPQQATVRLAIYNVLGAEVATLVNGTLPAGEHEVYWNGRSAQGNVLPSGLYVYRLETPGESFSRTMVLLK